MNWKNFSFLSRFFSVEAKKLRPFEKLLGYTFRNLRLLQRALTHKSYVNEQRLLTTDQNERYEFLGDAVLELAISHLMMDKFPDYSEGDLSKLRAAVVNEESLATLARQLDVGEYLYLGKGEDQGQGRTKDSLLADAYEAVLGAIYLDSNFENVFRVVHDRFYDLLESAKEQDIIRDYKTKLQEVVQDQFRQIPRYHLVSEIGPDHDKTFEVHLFIRDKIYGRGRGKSKKQAEQAAAKDALDRLEGMSDGK